MNPLAERLRMGYNRGGREAVTYPATVTAEEVTLMAEPDSTTPPFDFATIVRFWSKVRKDPDGCWRWTSTITACGYGQFKFRGKHGASALAHRVSWELHNGPIPAGLCVCHHCDNPCCVNPDHLFVGTPSDNMRDKAEKGRAAKGDRNAACVLSPDAVRAIRAMGDTRASHRSIARLHGVSHKTVSDILHGRRWTWLDRT